MANIEETKKKLEQLKKDQEALKAQLAELDTYLMKKYKKPKPAPSPSYTPTPTYQAPSPPSYPPAPSYPSYYPPSKPAYTSLEELKTILLNNINNSKKLMDKFDYLLDVLLSSLEEAGSEDVDKTIKLLAETQAHIIDTLTDTRKMLEYLENKTVTKEELDEFIKDQKERYSELVNRLNQLMSKVEEPAVLDSINSMQAKILELSGEIKGLEEEMKKGGKVKEISDRVNELTLRIASLEERLKAITELTQGLRDRMYSSEAALARIGNLEQELAKTKQSLQKMQDAILEEIGLQKTEVEKAVKEIEEAGKGIKGLEKIGEIEELEKKELERISEIDKEMASLEERLRRMEEIERRMDALEGKLEKISKFVDVYPIGEVQELSTLKRELEKVKPRFPLEHFERLQERLDKLEKTLNQMQRERELAKKEEEKRIEELITRLESKISSLEGKVSETKSYEILQRISEIENEIKNINQLRVELQKVKRPEELEALESKISEVENRILSLQSKISEIGKLVEERPEKEIQLEIGKLESMLDSLSKITITKKEMQEALSAIKEAISNLEGRLEELEKEQKTQSIEKLKEEVERIRESISGIETRVESEIIAKFAKQQEALLQRLNKLENLVKMGAISDEKIKDELGKVISETKMMERGLELYKDRYSKLLKQLQDIQKEVKKAMRAKKPGERVEKIKKRIEEVKPHPKQRISGIVSGIFKARKALEERPELTKKTERELERVLKEIEKIEGEISNSGLKRDIKKIKKDFQVIFSRVKKSPRKYAPELEKIEDELLDLKDKIEKVERESLLLFKLEEKLEEKEKQLKALNKAIVEGKAKPGEVREKIESLMKEISDLKNEINAETIKVHNIMKSLGEIKTKANEMFDLGGAREALEKARKALGKKDLKSAKNYLAKARRILGEKKSKEALAILKQVDELDSRIKKLGELKEKKIEELKKPEHKGLFTGLFESLSGLAHAHKREISKKGAITKERIENAREKLELLRKKMEEVKAEKARPKELEKARKELEELEKEVMHVKAKPSIPAKETRKALEKAEKSLVMARKELERLEKMAKKQKKKELQKYLQRTWIKSLIAEKQAKLTKNDLQEIAKALKESEKEHEKRMKKIEKVTKRLEKAKIPVEMMLIDYIENMKPGEETPVSELARHLRMDKNILIDKLKRISGKFKLENTGFLAKMLGKEPIIKRLE